MSGLRRFTMHPDRLRVEHERARTLAATGLVEALSPGDAATLAAHLDTCRECRQAALDYALQGERIHGLASFDLPRDAWPAFAARLDIEEARVAEQRARRAGSRRVASQAHPLGGRPSRAPGAFVPAPAGAVAGHRGAPVAASVGVGSLLALIATIALVASGLPGWIAGPSATPFSVDPSSVAWVSRQADGRFLLQTAALDRACPSTGAACADFAQKASTIVALDMEPASVFLSRGGRDAVIVDVGAAGAGTSGGSVYAIELPTPYPGTGGASTTPTATAVAGSAGDRGAGPSPRIPAPTDVPGGIAAGAALATATVTAVAAGSSAGPRGSATGASPRPTLVALASPPFPTAGAAVRTGGAGPVASFVTAGGPGASLPAAVPLPTAAATRAIAEDVVLVGGRAGYSPDGRWFAFSARPATASTGPDVYLWRVGDERSRAVTSDHGAVFAGWVGDRMLVSSPDGGIAKVELDPSDPESGHLAGSATATPTATPAPKASAAADASPAGRKSKATPTPKPAKGAAATPDGSPVADGADGSTAGDASASEDAAVSPAGGRETTPVSYLLDPASGAVTPIDLPGLWLPSVDPTGTRVVGWLGTVRADPVTRGWRPAEGSLVVGSWPTVLAGVAASPEPASPAPDAAGTAAPDAGVDRGAATSATTNAPPDADPGATASPDPDASADPQVGARDPAPAATQPAAAPDAEVTTAPDAEPTAAPDADGSEPVADADASDGNGTATTIATAAPGGAPTALAIAGISGLIPAAWHVRWDPTGTHLAIWVADPETPEVGRLSLLAVDQDGATAPAVLLSSTPAMPGFAMGKSRIAWATPADGTPAGGRVRVLVWSGAGVGEAGSAPIHGLETLVEAD